jgi:hypothetical protein
VASLFERLATIAPPSTEKTQENLFERLTAMAPPPAEKTPESVPNKKLEPAQRMLDWIQRWTKDTISIRDVRQYGPGSLRDPKSVLDAAEVLVKNGWLEPAESHRYDMRKWRVIRRPPIVAPKVD